MSSNVEFKVSVRLMTYNHQEFIEEAIAGIMMQKTNFPVEVVVGDDFSTDGTLDKVRRFSDTENIKIKILDRKKGDHYWENRQKFGRLYNFSNILENCSGKYIALLDGDDYWTDPYKLQKQVDFLENNPEYILSFHDAIVVNENNDIIEQSAIPSNRKRDFSEKDLKRGVLILPLTLCFRNFITEFPPELFNSTNGDTFLISLLGQYGKGKYLCGIKPGAYRKHKGGIWSKASKSTWAKNHIKTYTNLSQYYLRKKDREMSDFFLLKKKYAHLALIQHSIRKNPKIVLYHFKEVLKSSNYNFLYSFFMISKSMIKGLFQNSN